MSGPLDFPEDRRDAEDGPAGARAAGPEPAAGPARPPGPGGGRRRRYGWLIGIVALVAMAWILVNTLRTEGVSSSGVRPGAKLPPFAVPLALGDLDGDANVARRAGSGPAGSRPACAVRGPQILNVCQLAERGPVVLAFLATRGGDCTTALDRLDRVRGEFPGVQVAAVSVRGDRSDLRRLVRDRGWGFPVGYDRDGAVANLYGVAVCPQTTYAYPGGAVRATTIGEQSVADLRASLRRLVATSRERGWRAPARG
ncbi:TlpA family protein disulfide reductase [Capillimicrobium parvum]|uniref:Thioredoxin domain-containing protein n=1 Tax=Capillimicrobium parvum TaxID=2884022 RepID=A0A9E7C2T7_9ACTN|nr:TlpA disulfide reductase family protein [Capillimicrobium parvum]UGS37992.1 hypothetical protein DSM104329_04414 [Capillimicrobium parvum]